MRRAHVLVTAICLSACASSQYLGYEEDGGAPADTGSQSVLTGDAGTPLSLGGEDGSSTNACSGGALATANMPYVLSIGTVFAPAQDLYRFSPLDKSFTMVGTIRCQAPEYYAPTTLAIDQNGVAYVGYGPTSVPPDAGPDQGGSRAAMYRVSTQDASCLGAVTVDNWGLTGQVGGGYGFGIAFASTASSSGETLYMVGEVELDAGTGFGLSWLDLGADTLHTIALLGDGHNGGPITGTGDGRLFELSLEYGDTNASSNQASVEQVDPTTGGVSTPLTLTALPTYAAKLGAISFWGGHTYLFLPVTGDVVSDLGTTNVVDYDPATGALDTTYLSGVPFEIVGAGVSTCAPTEPPP